MHAVVVLVWYNEYLGKNLTPIFVHKLVSAIGSVLLTNVSQMHADESSAIFIKNIVLLVW